ncbi:LysR family transcriptional regulator [Pseudomonas sp. LTJR-52]|uniref:LysR family transcriptional regulator n=1 Tax=Pseudomonas sp. LTJR-52 TaxID=2479392 RepID=UPI000EFBD40F|nr:LysR family transcriptional regulator [Pseudomonas sp. LTJR-52]AYN96790.1 LysR family transcriptional regulator [Pseudomonas sp. LTJR-52]
MSARILSETAVRYFLQVVNSGSISEAATRLHVVPSAISRQISRLESELQTTLFERQSRGVILTAAGELLAGYARRTLLDAELVGNEIKALRQQSESLIKIACTEGFAPHCLPDAIAQFRLAGQQSTYQIQVASAQEVTRLVREAQADIGLCFSLGAAKGISVAYTQPAPVLALVAPGHPLASCQDVSLKEIVTYPLALPGPNSTLRQLLDIYCSREGLIYKSIMDSDSLETLVQFALSGSAVTFAGALFVRHRLNANQLKALAVPEFSDNVRSIEIQTLARRQLPGPMQAFIEHMKKVLSCNEGLPSLEPS